MGTVNLKVSNLLEYSPQQHTLFGKYVKFCVRALHLHDTYTGIIVHDKVAHGIHTTAISSHQKRLFLINGKGRAFSDVLRSIAHELVHFMQHERGDVIAYTDLHFSADHEDEANAMAGQLLNAFADVMGYEEIYGE